MSGASERRYDLDWLRIAAFGLLIFYHIGMFFVSWDWHVKSAHAGPDLQPLMLLTSPWRLALLFLIAGCATRFMADKTDPRIGRWPMLKSRSLRLLLPLVFGMLVIVPPQTYYEVVEKLGYAEGWIAFYAKYLSFYDGWTIKGQTLIVPTWNHLWFVVYLWVYTMIVIALRPALHAIPARGLVALFRQPLALLLLPPVFVGLLRLFLRPMFGETHALLDDWYLHAMYLSLFLFGYGIAKHDGIWLSIERLRWIALVLAALCYGGLVWFMLARQGGPGRQLLWAADQWMWILALLGFGYRWLRQGRLSDSPARRYLTDAIFPFYILHQTVIVVAGHNLTPLGLPAWGEGVTLIILTVAACFAGYEIVRRVAWLRPLFGLRTDTLSKRPAALQAG